MKRCLLVAVLVLISLMGLYASDGGRYALVVGNGAYEKTTKLANPVNDASDVADMLSDLGFKVRLETNTTLSRMEGAVREFSKEAKDAKASTTLFFYAGHGVQYEGINYLLPVDADIQKDFELKTKALSMDLISDFLEDTKSGFNLVMLDACRDNPFASGRGGSRGLGVMGGGTAESMVVFATAPGSVAQDGDGKNSPFTTALKQHLATPDLEVRQLVAAVSRSVQEMTGSKQIPWVNTSFTGQFFFLTAQQQLAKAESDAKLLQGELAALEAEIAEREASIRAAINDNERRRLEAEQSKAKALEAAKQVEASRIAEMEKQAEQLLLAQEEQDALRKEMEERLSSQLNALSNQAEMRKAELERLRLQQSGVEQTFKTQLEIIVQINQNILQVEQRYEQLLKKTLDDLDALYEAKVKTFRAETPKDPWETVPEYEKRITGDLAKLENEKLLERNGQEVLLKGRLEAETEPLRKQQREARTALDGKRFLVPASQMTVRVGDFDAEQKGFPITLTVQEELGTFTEQLGFVIESREREVLRNEFYRVYSAAQSGALVGSVAYRVYETGENIWIQVPEWIEVINLLESDSVLAKAWDRESLNSVVPIGIFEVEKTVRRLYHQRIGDVLLLSGLPEQCTLTIQGQRFEVPEGGSFRGNVGVGSSSGIKIESPWIKKEINLPLPQRLLPGEVIYGDVSSVIIPSGSLYVSQPNLVITVKDFAGEQVFKGMPKDGFVVKLPPGGYEVFARLPEDRYDPFSTHVEITRGEKTVINLTSVILSTPYKYEQIQDELAGLRNSWVFKPITKKFGAATLGIGVAGLATSIISYMFYSNAMQSYNDAVLSSDCEKYRQKAMLYGKIFSTSLVVGLGASVTGGASLVIQGITIKDLNSRIEAKELESSSLLSQMEADKARSEMEKAKGRL